jgi:diguanylate cyclase (GGDEF)-like protein/PAS domain S-box-containing protein
MGAKIGSPLPDEVVGLLKAVTLRMSDLFLGLTDEGLIRYVSANCTRLLGYDPQELIGGRALGHIHPDELATVTALLDDVIANGTPFTFPARLCDKAREYSWWEVQASPYTIGGERRIFLVARDIDEKVKAQAALAASEQLIRRLYDIASDPKAGLEEKLRSTLALGSARFGLPCATVSRYDDTETVVVARFGCVSGDEAVGAEGAPSLCGVIRVSGQPWGTLAYFDTQRRSVPFSEAEHDIMNLMTLLVGSEIERRQNQDEMRRLALHDPLTELPNRRLLDDRIDASIEMCKRFKTTCAVLFIDLDRFKAINDELGHVTGDAALREIAHRVAGQLRNVDTLARIGGDEFVALLPQTDAPGARTVADKIVETVRRPLRTARRRSITASIGIAVFSKASDSAAALVERADAAMYKVKSQGRCGVALSA